MDDFVFERLAMDAAHMGVQRIRFLGLNEPTLHPRLDAFIGLARGLGLKTHLISNGSFALNARRRAALLSNLPSELEVSLDALDWRTYRRVRGRGRAAFEALTASVATFFEGIDGQNCKRTVSFVLHDTDRTEFEAFRRLWATKVERVRGRVAHSFSGAVGGDFGAPTFPSPGNCAFIENRIAVDVDGRISACNLDDAGLHILGTCLDHGGLRTAWVDQKREALLHSFQTGDLDEQCRTCSRCAGLP